MGMALNCCCSCPDSHYFKKEKKKYYDHTYIAELDGKKSSNNDIDDVDVDID